MSVDIGGVEMSSTIRALAVILNKRQLIYMRSIQ